MITFKNFIAEQVQQISDIEIELNGYLAQKEIIKSKYEELKRKIDRILEKLFESNIAKPFLYGKGPENNKLQDEKLKDLVSTHIYSVRDLLALKNKINKVKMKDHHIFQAYESFYHDFSPIAQKIIDLKQYIVTAAKKKEEVKKIKTIEQKKKLADATSLIQVLTSFINEYVLEAEKRARIFYDKTMEDIKTAGGIDSIAPEVDFRKVGMDEYKRADQKRKFYVGIMKANKDHYIKEAGLAAHADYMAWVHKMIQKIGKPVVNAEMTGNPWIGSTIKVTTEDGEEQIWTTKMIINQSKYGNLFNQFPSRKK